MKWYLRVASRFSTVRELFGYLRQRGLWWLVPMVATLLILGALLIVVESSAAVPWIYTLF